MLAAVMVAATLASGCGPDYITQLPVLCERTVRAPYTGRFPVASDGSVAVEGRWRRRWRGLEFASSRGCIDQLRHRDLVAWVNRCGETITVSVGRLDRRAPLRAHVEVGGAWPLVPSLPSLPLSGI